MKRSYSDMLMLASLVRANAPRFARLPFGIGSLSSAFAGSANTLIATRALMGIGGAFIMPSTLSILTNVFTDAQERGKAIGVFSDYPAEAKLAALDLSADHVVSATDPGVATLQPGHVHGHHHHGPSQGHRGLRRCTALIRQTPRAPPTPPAP